VQDCDRQGSHPIWGWVLLPVAGELPRQEKFEVPQCVVSGVYGPHGRKYLAHRAEVLLHSLFLHALALCSKDSRSSALRKQLEKRDGFTDSGQIFWDANPSAEHSPFTPRRRVVLTAASVDTFGDHFE